MRSSIITLVFTLLALSASTLARVTPYNTRQSDFERRQVVSVGANTCIKLAQNLNLATGTTLSPVTTTIAGGTCLCIDGALSTGVALKLRLSTGQNITLSLTNTVLAVTQLTALVNPNVCLQASAALFGQANVVPDYSQSCCGLTCATGYVNCNNVCIPTATQVCVSGMAQPKRKRSLMCPFGTTRCGTGGSGFECVNTDSNIESCGGCMYGGAGPTSGEDCTAIANTNEVNCIAGICVIQSCQRGFQLDTDGTSCIPRVKVAALTKQILYGAAK